MTKTFNAFCMKGDSHMNITRTQLLEMMKYKKSDIVKRYGISSKELTRCCHFFSIQKWKYDKRFHSSINPPKQLVLDQFWTEYEDKRYKEDMKYLFEYLERDSNVTEFLSHIE